MKIGQFQKAYGLNLSDDDIDGRIKFLSVMTGKDIEEIEALSLDDFKKLAATVKVPKLDAISDKLRFDVKVKGITFNSVLNIKNISTAEFLELSHFTKDEKTIISNLHKIIAIFYKPKHKWFGLKKVNMSRPEAAEFFMQYMDVQVAYGISVFFLKSWKKSMPLILNCLTKDMKRAAKMIQKELDKG